MALNVSRKTGKPRVATPYQFGKAAEDATRNALRNLGYHVIRAAASQGIFDLVAFAGDGGPMLAIQVKRGQRPSPCDYKGATALPVPDGILKMVLWYPDGLQAVRVLYCADATGPVSLPDWCASVRWQAGLPPRQQTLRGLRL